MNGNRPDRGFALQDGQWLRGLSDGINDSFASISSFPGGGQANGVLLPNQSLIEIATVATDGDSVRLPYAYAGTRKFIYNSGANDASMYASAGNNKVTGTQDKINGGANATAFVIAAGATAIVFCPRDGAWAAGLLTLPV